MADPMEAILASMAAATGNASPPKKPKPAATAASNPASKKRERESPASPSRSIWNPHEEMLLDSATLDKLTDAAKSRTVVNPSMEIARQQIVRAFCSKIRRASEDLGIGKLPNSAYETWQFTSQLTVTEHDPLIPHAGSDYSGLFEELRKAGATKSGAAKKCKELTRESERMLRKFGQQDFVAGKKKVQVAVIKEGTRQLTYGRSTVKLSAAYFAKLCEMYARKQGLDGDGSSMAPKDQRQFESALFCLLLRYDSLDGGGFQAALNEECFDVLLKEFNCKMECFASPLNCRYSRFCSAFLDTDFVFGSVGSFFDFSPRTGCFEANPPFIPKVIKRMADHMTALLTAADGPLAFVVIIPAWQETEGWQQLNASRFNQKHLLIPQKQHGYCEGKQQIRKTRWRTASFDTSVFFLQNAKAYSEWPITEKKLESLKHAFKSKQAEERDAQGLRKSGKGARSTNGTW